MKHAKEPKVTVKTPKTANISVRIPTEVKSRLVNAKKTIIDAGYELNVNDGLAKLVTRYVAEIEKDASEVAQK